MKKILVFALLLLSIVSQVFSQDIKSGLVAYFPFNGNANDESGNRNNAVIFGASLTNGQDGTSNGAYYFDGIDDYISIGRPLGKSIPKNLTYCVWAKLSPKNGFLTPIIYQSFNAGWISLFIIDEKPDVVLYSKDWFSK